MLELKDTVVGMTSPDYKERFIAEYTQLGIRAKKLKDFLIKIKFSKQFGVEPPKHDCPVSLLDEQLMAMLAYLVILKQRAEIEKIELPKIEDDEKDDQ